VSIFIVTLATGFVPSVAGCYVGTPSRSLRWCSASGPRFEFDDAVGEQVVDRRPRPEVTTLRHLDDQVGSRLLRIAQIPAERPADLAVLSADWIAADLHHELPHLGRSLIPGALRSFAMAKKHHATIVDLSWTFWTLYSATQARNSDHASQAKTSVGRVGIEPTTQGL
jgi:hypothetical protein